MKEKIAEVQKREDQKKNRTKNMEKRGANASKGREKYGNVEKQVHKKQTGKQEWKQTLPHTKKSDIKVERMAPLKTKAKKQKTRNTNT